MSNDEIKKITDVLRTVVKEEIKPLNDKVSYLSEKLVANTEELKSVSEQVATLTVKVDGEIIPTLEIHTKLLKEMAAFTEKNTNNINRLDKRLSTLEANAGIQSPSEFNIVG